MTTSCIYLAKKIRINGKAKKIWIPDLMCIDLKNKYSRIHQKCKEIGWIRIMYNAYQLGKFTERKENMDLRYNVYQLANVGQSCAWMGKVGRYMLAGMVIAIIIIISIIISISIIIISILISRPQTSLLSAPSSIFIAASF